jgi:hypothetical protein
MAYLWMVVHNFEMQTLLDNAAAAGSFAADQQSPILLAL